jgi:hypothetical protein
MVHTSPLTDRDYCAMDNHQCVGQPGTGAASGIRDIRASYTEAGITNFPRGDFTVKVVMDPRLDKR